MAIKQPVTHTRLPAAIRCLLLAAAIIILALITLPEVLAQAPGDAPDVSTQAEFPWNIHLYASATSPNGDGLWVFTGETDVVCADIAFDAEVIGSVPTPLDAEYLSGANIYRGFLDDFFKAEGIAENETVEAELTVKCTLDNGDKLVTPVIKFWRYYYPNDTSLITIPSDDNNAKLTLNANSLNGTRHIIVMQANALPRSLPVGLKMIGLPYSFRSYVTESNSDGNMILDLAFTQGFLGDDDPLTLRIYEWDVSKQWLDTGKQTLSVSTEPGMSKIATEFTTFVLASTPRWRDGFHTGVGLESLDNIRHNTDIILNPLQIFDQLELSDTTVSIAGSGVTTGTAISTPYTPTFQLGAWDSISYTAEITAGTSMTVSVLSLDGQVLAAGVQPGDSLGNIKPADHPSLRLRVEMATTVAGRTPILDEWSILAAPQTQHVYLPLVLKE